MRIRNYAELSKFKTFEERFNYLSLDGKVGNSTFGYDRYLNQILYQSYQWKKSRNDVIVRDNGNNLGIEDYPIHDMIIVHHMNPITLRDIEEGKECVYNPDYLICTSHDTHNAIHYGDISKVKREKIIIRKQNDTTPWKNEKGNTVWKY